MKARSHDTPRGARIHVTPIRDPDPGLVALAVSMVDPADRRFAEVLLDADARAFLRGALAAADHDDETPSGPACYRAAVNNIKMADGTDLGQATIYLAAAQAYATLALTSATARTVRGTLSPDWDPIL